MTLAQLLSDFPPVLCRLLARRKGQAISNRQLATLAGMPRSAVDRLSKLPDWYGTPINHAVWFMGACGVDLLHVRRHREVIRRKRWSHWDKNPKYFKHLLQILIDSHGPE